jgi:predicted metal-dependent peptidase
MKYAIDTSGGMFIPELIDAMIRHVSNAGDASGIVFFDHGITNAVAGPAFTPDDVKGGGGTLIQPVFDWMRDNAPGERMVMLSDGCFETEGIDTHGIVASLVLVDRKPEDVEHVKRHAGACFTNVGMIDPA